MPAVSVKKLTVKYDNRVILDNLSFDIPEGSITAIIGPNGSGKTTLLKALLGLIPYKGTVEILKTTSAQARTKIGYVPQRFTFDKSFPITVKEFLSFTLPANTKDKNTLIDCQLQEVGMFSEKDNILGALSGGQLQRVLIARALLNNPKIIFLDEAAAGIDVKGERNFYDLIKHLNEKHGVTIIFISHEIDIVHSYATQVLCLNRQMLCFGRPDEVLNETNLKQLFDANISLYQHKYHKHD